MSANLSANTLFNVNGIVAVITGGGSGIGLMMTKALVANGAHLVYIVGRREDVLRSAAESIDPKIVIPLPGDVTSRESLLEIAKHVETKTGSINLLICNAGIMGPKPLKAAPGSAPPSLSEYRAHALETPMEEFTNTYAVNTTAVYYTTLAFLSLLDAGNTKSNMGADVRSQVITTSSIGGFSRLPGASFAYNSSKAAVTHMTKMLATSFVPYGIRCNIQFLAEPFHRMFFLDNLAIGYPHAEIERVPVSWLFIYAGAVPLGTLVAWALILRPEHTKHMSPS
ncbi:uncharacterized protein ALTATR162_LOCUS8106 [Alternaria atra]|uniref:NAD(P)-binding protein n=1 Tax=Alternaria atra TaxID=119953 RepID=A0A8J2N2C2_9PLEO|nr:uncharacterized protein ALTATR162_LOCUS8106 [Alternaria atra]CAG5175442.1 unnamed protein product [Alternaria atra]